jgi:predicted ATPase/DNA-binding SARP family transcriptional activator
VTRLEGASSSDCLQRPLLINTAILQNAPPPCRAGYTHPTNTFAVVNAQTVYNKAMPSLHVRLLGSPQVTAGTSFPFALERRYQFLAYLAYQGAWVRRDQLAYLFWSDLDDEAARRNVRKTLFKVRQLTWLENLEQNADALRWSVETDVSAFQRALREEKLEVALELYCGPFLQGMELKAEGEFASWLELERQRLHALFREAVFKHADTLATRGKTNEATKPLQELLEYDALDEEAVQKLLALFNNLGEREKGLHLYHVFAATLERELGLEPNVETQRLLEQLQKSRPAKSEITPSPSFVGRTLELQELRDLLAQSDCRLLTILGAGGVGKTRVALQLTQHVHDMFADGIHVVLLEALTKPTQIASKITEVLGLNLQSAQEPLEYLKAQLANQQLLLVLDNFEHLVSGAFLLRELLGACPHLKLLVTSRERLKLEGEWLLPLEGLSYPKDVDVTLEEALSYDAVQLFLGRAKRLQPHFTLTNADVPYLVEMCRLVDGFPLGLELAAPWVRHLPLSGIATEIKQNLDFLSNENRDAAGRQQSMRATFEHSWKLLSSKEQEALRSLSVFRGGFKREAAEYVSDASLPLLSSLVDKSLVRFSPAGRYDRHPLLYEFIYQKLADYPEEKTRLQLKHEEYFFRLLEEKAKDYKTDRQKQALDVLQQEHDNIKVAWYQALSGRHFAQLERVAIPFAYYYQIRGPWQEGLEIFSKARAAFRDGAASSHSRAAEGEVASGQAMLHCCVGHFAEAIATAQEAIAFFQQVSKEERTIIALNILGIAHFDTGDYNLSRNAFEQALKLAQEYGDKARVTALLGNLGVVEIEAGHLRVAEQRYKELTSIYRQDKNDDGLVAVLSDFGDLLRMMGQFDEARNVFEEGLSKAEALGIEYVTPSLLLGLGRLCLEQKHYDGAQHFLSRALAKSRELGSLRLEAEGLQALGTLALEQGEVEQVQKNFLQALRLSRDIKAIPNMLAVLTCIAALKVRQEQPALAVSFLTLVLEHPVTRRTDKEVANVLLEQVRKTLAPRAFTKALEQGRTLELGAVIEDILR